MKLLSLHISGYGALKNYDYTFTDGVNEFCEHNGFGKSTLASFIRAMFYGLEGYSVRTKDFCDRLHFYPFTGGSFSGSLTFEKGGKTYRIERAFGEKSEKDDTLTVYCNNAPFTGFGESLGKWVFGVDKESFERTAFIDNKTMEIAATGGISALLNGVVEGIADGTVEDALDRLQKAKKEIKADRGNGGELSKVDEKIKSLQNEIVNLQEVESALPPKYGQLNAYEAQKAEQDGMRKKMADNKVLLGRWEIYEQKRNDIEKKKEQLNEIAKTYPLGLPENEQTEQLLNQLDEYRGLNREKTGMSPDVENQKRLLALNEQFAIGKPDGAQLSEVSDDLERCKKLRYEMDGIKATPAAQSNTKFAVGMPTQEALNKAQANAKRIDDIDRELQIRQESPVAPQKKAGNKLALIVTVVCAMALAAGVGLIFVNALIGGIVAGVGGLGVIAGLFLWFKGQPQATPSGVDEGAIRLKTERNALEDEIKTLLIKYDFYTPNGNLAVDLLTLNNAIAAHMQALQAEREKAARLQQLTAEYAQINEQITVFLSQYGVAEQSVEKGYDNLCADIKEHARLTQEQARYESATQEIDKKIKALYGEIQAFITKWQLCVSGPAEWERAVRQMQVDGTESKRLQREIDFLTKQAEIHREQYHLTQKPQVIAQDEAEFEAAYKALTLHISHLQTEIEEDEADVARLQELQNQRDTLQETRDALDKRLRSLLTAMATLKNVDEQLKERFVAPVRNHFVKYAAIIEQTLGQKVEMGKNFQIQFEREGKLRSDKHLSDGLHSICALCYRLALIDNMYKDEQPFVVMDDPFVHLDKIHMQNTQTLVRELAKERQILYFSCHESRKIM